MIIIPEIRTITSKIEPLLGQKCWQAKTGHGSFLTLEFGKIKIPARQPFQQEKLDRLPPTPLKRKLQARQKELLSPRGEWHLWIYTCNWKIFHLDRLLAHNENCREIMQNAVSQFNKLTLKYFQFFDAYGKTIFTFENGYILNTFPLL